MQSRNGWCKIAAHAAPQFEGISCANRSCMQKDSLRWHVRMRKLLLGCVSVYSSSETAIGIGLQVGHKCSEPDNGTALLNAICQPPGHALKQIAQVCWVDFGSGCLQRAPQLLEGGARLHSTELLCHHRPNILDGAEIRTVCRPGLQEATRSQSPGLHHRRGSSVNPGSILLQNPRPSAEEYLAVSLESRQHYILIFSSGDAGIQTPIFPEKSAVFQAATRHQHQISQAEGGAAHVDVQRGGTELRGGHSCGWLHRQLVAPAAP